MQPLKIILYYPILAGGGCEKRLGELGRWLLDNGDEAWIVAAGIHSDIAYSLICGQAGFPLQRILFMPAGGCIEEFVYNASKELEADILDVQWCDSMPEEFPCTAVYTTHGLTQPLPLRNDFAAHISVDTLPPHSPNMHYAPVVETVWNWVNLDRFPYQEELGEGAAFFGRSFKLHNAKKIAGMYDGTIDAYGISTGGLEDLPANIRWQGFADPSDYMYNYRIIFASAITALEAVAAGRLVICGHDQGGYVPDGRLVLPEMMAGLSAHQFWYSALEAHRGIEPTADQVFYWFTEAMGRDYHKERRKMRQYIEENHDMQKQCRKIREVYERAKRV